MSLLAQITALVAAINSLPTAVTAAVTSLQSLETFLNQTS